MRHGEVLRSTGEPSRIFLRRRPGYLTHLKKLKDPQEPPARLLDRPGVLEEKLEPILFQPLPSWRMNVERLGDSLKLLPKDHRYASFEFRDASRFDDRIYELLAEQGTSSCMRLRGYVGESAG